MPLDPSELVRWEPDRAELPREGLVMLVALDGFVDAGAARRLAYEQLRETLSPSRVATFDHDQLHDYRARRPAMLFVEDHWESYVVPELAVEALTDLQGRPFLLLSGPEPDVQWERFVAAVRQVARALGVGLTLGLNAIPMGVPHTRPVGMLLHGTRRDLLTGQLPWLERVQVPGSAAALLELRFGEHGMDAVGVVAQVPHYVATLDYPAAAAALLDEVGRIAGLALPAETLREQAVATRSAIDAQVAESAELQQLVAAVEQSHDAVTAARAEAGLAGRPLPSGEELGAQFERFLAEQRPKEEGPGGGS